MRFVPVTLEDVELFRPFTKAVRAETCDFTLGGVFMWRDYYRMEYAVEDGALFSRLYNTDGERYYLVPMSPDIPASLDRLIKEAGTPIKFCTVPEPFLKYLRMPGMDAVVSEQPDYADYLYTARDLASYPGKSFHGQRNLVNRFMRTYEDWSFEPLDQRNLGRVRDFFLNKYLPHSADGDTEREENRKVLETLDFLDRFGFVGGVLTAGGEVVGFSLNEIIGSAMFTHIEKADRSVSGAYQMLVMQSAESFAKPPVEFINREEDMGDPGLRSSKESYHPAAKLKKYVVELS